MSALVTSEPHWTQGRGFSTAASATWDGNVGVAFVIKTHCLCITMAAALSRVQVNVKESSSSVDVPIDPLGRLMYYFDCVCCCVEPDSSDTIKRFRDYKNHDRLTSAERAQLMAILLTLNPDKLISCGVFHPTDDEDLLRGSDNAILKLTAVKTDVIVTDALLVGGQRRRVQRIMVFKDIWMEWCYRMPIRELQPPPKPAESSCTIS